MKTYFPKLKRWRKALNVTNDEAMKVNPALAGVKELIAQMADSLPIAYISSVDNEGFKGMMLRGTMEVLTDAKSKEMIWREGDTEYYPGGVTDPNYCVLKFTATDGRFYSDFYPRSFVI